MDNDLRTLYRSSDPQKRKQALRLMAQNPDERTEGRLLRIAKTDPDADVRRMAQKLLSNLTQEGSSTPARSEASKQDAKRLLDKAFDALISTNFGLARRLARIGFQTYPGWQYDEHYRQLAADLMRMEPDAAIEALLSEETPTKTKAKRKKSKQPGFIYKIRLYFNKEQATWGDVLSDILIYIGVVTLPLLILLLLGNALFSVGLKQMQNAQQTSQTQEVSLFLAQFAGFDGVRLSLGLTLLFVLLAVLPSFLVYAFQMFLTHISATFFLDGDGSFRNLLHRILLPMIIMSIFYWIMLIATPFLYALELTWPIESGLLDVISVFAVGAYLFWLSNVVGGVYGFDFGKGCLAMMFPYLALFGCACATVSMIFFKGLFFG